MVKNTIILIGKKIVWFFSFQQEMESTCNCSWTILPPFYNNTPRCPFNAGCAQATYCPQGCASNMLITQQYNLSFYLNKYYPNCSLECDTISYETSISSQNYPSIEEYRKFKNDPSSLYGYYQSLPGVDMSTYSLYRKYFYKVNIFYDKSEYLYVELTPALTLIGFLSNVGGSLGAILAITICSLMEILELLFRIIAILLFS